MEEKKYCKFCGEQMDINSAICPKCGKQQEVVEPVAVQPTPIVEPTVMPPQPVPETVVQETPAQVVPNPESSVNVATPTMTPPQETKYCRFCGGQIDKNSIVCPKCGRQLEKIHEEPTPVSYNQAPSQPVTNQKSKKGKAVKIIITVVVCLVVLGIIFGGGDDTKEVETNNGNNNNNIIQENKKTSYTFNETFEFDDLEITIGENYTFTKVTNQYSDHYQKEAVKLPITIKNIKDQTHSLNMFYYSMFGSTGVEVHDLGFYYDDSIEYAGELRPGASYTTYLYFVYDGDGTYAIEFDDIWNKQTVEIEIKK